MRKELTLCASALHFPNGRTISKTLDCSQILPWFGPRELLEENKAFRQIIPYIVLKHQGRILTYERASGGSEERLRGKTSIGFGGHISVRDAVFSDEDHLDLARTLRRAALREVREETGISLSLRPFSATVIGWIVDDSNQVGLVHVGYAEIWEIDAVDCVEALRLKSSEITKQRMLTTDELRSEFEWLENWSQLSLEQLQTR